jgi:hypothetical protein
MAQTTWYLKIQDNLIKYKDKLFRPSEYIDLKAYIQETIDANPSSSGASAITLDVMKLYIETDQ